MKHRSGAILFMLIGFFAGVIATVCVLTPGPVGPTILVGGDEAHQKQQLSQAGDNIQQAGVMAAYYAHQAKSFIKENLPEVGGR